MFGRNKNRIGSLNPFDLLSRRKTILVTRDIEKENKKTVLTHKDKNTNIQTRFENVYIR